NAGDAATSASWVDRVYLSTNGQLAGATLLASVTRPADLAPSDHYDQSALVTLPNFPDGDYYILIVADAANEQVESDETNNVRSLTISLTSPDLTVSAATAPASAALAETIPVSWTVTNQSNAGAFTDWTDRVYYSADPLFDA